MWSTIQTNHNIPGSRRYLVAGLWDDVIVCCMRWSWRMVSPWSNTYKKNVYTTLNLTSTIEKISKIANNIFLLINEIDVIGTKIFVNFVPSCTIFAVSVHVLHVLPTWRYHMLHALPTWCHHMLHALPTWCHHVLHALPIWCHHMLHELPTWCHTLGLVLTEKLLICHRPTVNTCPP